MWLICLCLLLEDERCLLWLHLRAPSDFVLKCSQCFCVWSSLFRLLPWPPHRARMMEVLSSGTSSDGENDEHHAESLSLEVVGQDRLFRRTRGRFFLLLTKVLAETFHHSSAPFPPKFKEEWVGRHEQHDAHCCSVLSLPHHQGWAATV